MSFTFVPEETEDDLRALARAASIFLAPGSTDRLKLLADDLRNAVARAKATSTTRFTWATVKPVRIKPSRNWKGTTNNFDPLFGDVTVDYDCDFLADGRVSVREGVTVVKLKREVDPDGASKILHFDAEKGGWDARAGHPPLHFQFYGFVNDLPRIPSLIVHPLDVISLTLLELHQSKWRDHVAKMKPKSELRHFPNRQRKRLKSIATKWAVALEDPTDHGPIILQRRLNVPHAL